MSRTAPPRAPTRAAVPTEAPGQQPLAMLSRTTSAMVRATGELQQRMAHSAALLQQEAAHQLRQATSPAELVTLQTALMVAGWQQSIQCTQDFATTWLTLGGASARRDPQLH